MNSQQSFTFCGCLCLGLLILGGCDRSHQATAATAPPPRPASPVTVAAAMLRDVPVYLDEIGRCSSRESVTIQPQVDGRLTQAHFVEGATVHKGDPLFSIHERPFQADLD